MYEKPTFKNKPEKPKQITKIIIEPEIANVLNTSSQEEFNVRFLTIARKQ